MSAPAAPLATPEQIVALEARQAAETACRAASRKERADERGDG